MQIFRPTTFREGEILTFHLVLVDAAVNCSPRASLNFVEFTWDNIKTFAFIKYAIVCIPLETPKILFLRNYRAANDRWRTFNLCAACCSDSMPTIHQFVNNCAFPPSYFNYPNSCKCNICLRQPPTLRDFASHFVFHLTFNLSEFQLTARTLYHHYLHAANSHLVPEHQLIPHTGICFRSATLITLCERVNRFHEYCIPDRDVLWRSFDNEHCASYEEVIATLCYDRNRWWCAFCDGPLFIPAQCLVDDANQ